MKVKFSYTSLLLFAVIFLITFLFLVLLKVLSPEETITRYMTNNFYVLFGVMLLSSLVTKKFVFSTKVTERKTENNRVILSAIISLIGLLLLKRFYSEFYGQLFLIYFVAIVTAIELFIVYIFYAIARSRNVGSDSLEEIEKKREQQAKERVIKSQTKTDIVQNYLSNKRIFNWINMHSEIESDKTAIYATSSNLSIELLPRYSANTIINLRKVNDIIRINRFFELVNDKLPQDGLFVGIAETIENRNSKILKKYIFPFNRIIVTLDFIINRVFPKVKLTQDLYFSYTHGSNRPLSKAEVLGRLYSCGFEVVSCSFVESHFLFCVKKVKTPLYDNNPTYGPFVSLRRVTKNGKISLIYKMRTMYPYSEYIQKYVYDMYGTNNGDKAENDFRITGWGRFFRKFWLDELPMFINLFKGDVKIVGVRPLSRTKFDTYPVELQEKRIKTKPGLVPPFYADMPKTQEELFESEDRYLDAYLKSPFLTDFIYFWKAFYNIVIKKARSK